MPVGSFETEMPAEAKDLAMASCVIIIIIAIVVVIVIIIIVFT